MLDDQKALVLFSGGQDSTTCLAWALDRFATVDTIGFAYGQRHEIELSCREPIREALRQANPAWGQRLSIDQVIDLGVLGTLSETALTRPMEIALSDEGLPTTFVPGRNLLFLTVAAITAYRCGAKHIVGGMCETDFSGYADCRDDTIKAMQLALNLGMARQFVLHTPLMWIDKSATWGLAQQLGGEVLVDAIRRETHTCYLGNRVDWHQWGYGCGTCPACELRAHGYDRFRRNLPRASVAA